MKILHTICAVAIFASLSAVANGQAEPNEAKKVIDTAQLQGKHTARYWGFRIFDAELWTAKAGKFSFDQDFALSISYLYPFTKELLARTSVEDIARVEGGKPEDHAKLEKLLVGCLVDVDKYTRITGVAESANKLTMYVNGRNSCTMSYPNVRKRFFGIWLAPTSRDAKGAQRLRGNG
ncbi:MAG: hypothetical protein QNK92_02890 [Amylibacter sp.]